MAEAPPPVGPTTAVPRQPGLREALFVGVVVVTTVLAAAAVTALLPREVQAVVFHTPLLILVLLAGTGAVLWRIVRTPRS